MNVPLNIDLQQILLHLLNFSVLSLGLYLLLYRPVQDFMQKRADYYLGLKKQAEDQLKQAEELKQTYEKRLESVEAEAKQTREKALREANQAVDALLQSAQQQASRIISEAQKAAQREREKVLEEAQKEITSMVLEATEKILAQSASDNTLDQFLYSVNKE